MARPEHKPNAEGRKTAKALAAFGIPQNDIARQLGIDAKTLRKHYATELDTGATEANAKVAQTLYQQAVGGNTVACMFWLKTRAGWREKADVEHSGGIEVRIVRE